MAAKILLLEAQPRNPSTGARITVRLAGGGDVHPNRYDGEDWIGGLEAFPSMVSALAFDGADFGNGGTPQSFNLRWGFSTAAKRDAMAGYHWKDAPFTIYFGEENAAGTLPAELISGKITEHTIREGKLELSLSDDAVTLNLPVLVDTFAGTGGVEGPSEFEGRPKRRAWGQVFNVELIPIDSANNIYVATDPGKQLNDITAVRDKGADAASLTVVNWQGSVAATFTALQGASAPEGGGVVAPSIGMVKWWTRPAGLLCADLEGEDGVGGSYVDRPGDLAEAIVSDRTGVTFASGTVTAANAAKPYTCGILIESETQTIAQALNYILGGCGLYWLLDGGGIRIGEWEFGAAAASFVSASVDRVGTYSPLQERRIGHQRNHRIHTPGDIAEIILWESGITGRPEDGEFTRGLALASMNTGGVGDLRFDINTTGSGGSNDGEIRVRGSTYFPPQGDRHNFDQTRREIQTPYESTRIGYPFFIIFTEEDADSRFPGWGSGSGANPNFICAEYDAIARQWTARDNTYAGFNFTPIDTDCIVAVCEKRAASGGIESLSSLIGLVKTLPTVQRNATGEYLFSDNFDNYEDRDDFEAAWEFRFQAQELTTNIPSAAMAGGVHVRIGNNSGDDDAWYVARERIPYDPEAIYEIEWEVRQRLGAGGGATYLGVAGYTEDKVTPVNVTGSASGSSQHYVALSNVALPVGNNEVQRFRGYFSGRAASGNGGQHNSIADPATLHDDVDFFSPLFIANWQNQAGQLDISLCRVRKVSVKTIQPSTGRVIDPIAYNTQAILGPRNTTNLNPSYGTPSGGNVDITLPAHSRMIAGINGLITLNYGSSSGQEPVSTYWAAYIDDPDLTGFSSPSVVFTNNADDLLRANRYQIASGVTPNSSGSGGGTGSGGGGGGGFPDCVSPEAWVEVSKRSKRSRKCENGRHWVQAKHIVAGDYVRSLDQETLDSTGWNLVTQNFFAVCDGIRIEMPDGASLELSHSTPFTLPDGSSIPAKDIDGREVAQLVDGKVVWAQCKAVDIGEIEVAHISCGSGTYLAGMERGSAIFSHNFDKP